MAIGTKGFIIFDVMGDALEMSTGFLYMLKTFFNPVINWQKFVTYGSVVPYRSI